MKIPCFFLLMACVSNAYAAPPSLNDSSYDSSYGGSGSGYSNIRSTALPVTSAQVSDSLYRIQADIVQLKTKINDQSRIISDLKLRQDKLEQKQLALSNSSSVRPPIDSTLVSDGHINASSDEKLRYAHAYELLRVGDNDHAIAEFQSLVNTYPTGEYADNALYWTGEALLKKGDKLGAMRAFDRVVYAYPRSAKVPDALLKLGMTQLSVGNKIKAKEYYDYLISTYPGTPSASLAYEKKAQAGL